MRDYVDYPELGAIGNVFMKPVRRFLAGGMLCLMWAPFAHAATQPNILLLVAEDLSPRIASFGDALADTPNIDDLAAAGTRFTSVFTTAGVCAPSRAALITGQHQISFGGQHMRTSTGPLGEYFAQPDPQLRAFPEILRANGYFTFTDNKLDYQFSGVRAGSGPFSIWDRQGADDFAWRERAPGQPFFGLINFMETHESGIMRANGEPHSATHKATQQWRRAGNLVSARQTSPADVTLPPYYPDLPSVRSDMARHYDNIRMMDTRVGRIIEALRAQGLSNNTIVIWTTDHGDGLPRAKRELYDSGLHVPLILYVPPALQKLVGSGLSPLPAQDDRLVSFVDLAPTILKLANIPAPEYLHGQSIFSSERGYIFASRDRIDEVKDRQRAIRSNHFKYIRSWHPEVPGGHALAYRDNLDMVRAWRTAYQSGNLNAHQRRWFEPVGTEQLYDIVTDPHELTNLATSPEHQNILRTLSAELDAFLQKVGDTSEQAEQTMRDNLLVDGAVPTTPAPVLQFKGDLITMHSANGASIGYRYRGESHWHLYHQPVQAPDQNESAIEAKAVRYGWRESQITSLRLR